MKIIAIEQQQKTEHLNLKISKNQRKELEKVAKRSKVTISEAVRQLLDFGLKHVL